MIAGMTLPVFVHVVISLIAITAGIIVAVGLLTNKLHERLTGVFLATTIATSVTGLVLPATQFLPSHVFAILSLAVLAVAVVAKYSRRLAGSWRPIYIATALFALYLNLFVLVVQIFLKVPVARALAPTQSELPFVIAQSLVLALTLLAGVSALGKFRPLQNLPATATNA